MERARPIFIKDMNLINSTSTGIKQLNRGRKKTITLMNHSRRENIGRKKT
jgi:hypothetical protein